MYGINCALNSATLRPLMKKIGSSGRIGRSVRNCQVWAIFGSFSLLSAFSPSFYATGTGLDKRRKKREEQIQITDIVMKKTERFFTAPITKADIR